jgi:hypothetical protein
VPEPVWLAPTLVVLRGGVPLGRPRPRAMPGKTHCGQWWPVPLGARERYGWACRLVCVRVPQHGGLHENRQGWRWSDRRAPHRA